MERPQLALGVVALRGRPGELVLARSARAVAVVPGGEELLTWLRGLAAGGGAAEVVRDCPLGTDAAISLLGELDRAGLLQDRAAPRTAAAGTGPPRPGLDAGQRAALHAARQRRRVLVAGAGPIAAEALGLLHDGGLQRAEAVGRDHLRGADLIVSIGGSGLPGRNGLPQQDAAWRSGIPALAVEVTDRDAVIAPLSIPGVSPCPRCRWLRLADQLPEWPLVDGLLRDVAPPLGAARRSLLTGLVAERALLALDALLLGPEHPAAAAAWEEVSIDFATATVHSEHVSVDPRCGCAPAAA